MNEDKNIRKNKDVFKVPENYFDEFQARMSDLTSEEFSTSAAKSRTGIRIAYAIPALMVVIVAGYLFFSDTDNNASGLASVSTEDLIDFLEEDGISEDELISYLDYSVEEIDLYPEEELLNEIDDSELENLSDELDVFNEYL